MEMEYTFEYDLSSGMAFSLPLQDGTLGGYDVNGF